MAWARDDDRNCHLVKIVSQPSGNRLHNVDSARENTVSPNIVVGFIRGVGVQGYTKETQKERERETVEVRVRERRTVEAGERA